MVLTAKLLLCVLGHLPYLQGQDAAGQEEWCSICVLLQGKRGNQVVTGTMLEQEIQSKLPATPGLEMQKAGGQIKL